MNKVSPLPVSANRSRIARRSSHGRGFTLIEMIVSLMIFAVVAVVALGAVIKVVSTNQKAQTLQSSITNMNFALDAMSRDLRVGSTFFCSNNISAIPSSGNTCSLGVTGSSGAIIVFQSPKTAPGNSSCFLEYAYRFNPQGSIVTLEKAQQSACGIWSAFTPIVSTSDVTITSYYLRLSTASYPLIYIEVSGYSGLKVLDRTYFDVETALSPRTP